MTGVSTSAIGAVDALSRRHSRLLGPGRRSRCARDHCTKSVSLIDLSTLAVSTVSGRSSHARSRVGQRTRTRCSRPPVCSLSVVVDDAAATLIARIGTPTPVATEQGTVQSTTRGAHQSTLSGINKSTVYRESKRGRRRRGRAVDAAKKGARGQQQPGKGREKRRRRAERQLSSRSGRPSSVQASIGRAAPGNASCAASLHRGDQRHDGSLAPCWTVPVKQRQQRPWQATGESSDDGEDTACTRRHCTRETKARSRGG